MKGIASGSLQELLTLAQRAPVLTLVGTKGLALTATTLLNALGGPLFLITPTVEDAERLLSDLRLFLKTAPGLTALPYPAWDVEPYEGLSPHTDVAMERLTVLHRLANSPRNLLVVAPAVALLKRTLPKKTLKASTEVLRVGEDLDRDAFLRRLTEIGYLVTDSVEDVGFVSVRGDIVDVFGPLADNPVRIEWFGDTVESIRVYDLETQRSTQTLRTLWLPPVREEILSEENVQRAGVRLKDLSDHLEKLPHLRRQLVEDLKQGISFPGIEYHLGMLEPELGLLTDYLPDNARVMLLKPEAIGEQWRSGWTRIQHHYEVNDRKDRLQPPPDSLFVEGEVLDKNLKSFQQIGVIEQGGTELTSLTGPKVQLKFESTSGLRQAMLLQGQGHDGGLLKPLVERLQEWHDAHIAAYVVCHTEVQVKRLRDMLEPYHVKLPEISSNVSLDELLNPFSDTRYLIRPLLGQLSEGFRFPEGRLVMLGEEDLFGPKVQTSSIARKKLKNVISSFSQLNRGDPVVHSLHGVGLFRGLVKLEMGGAEADFLQLEYADGDKLYLPAHRVSTLQKYVGQGNAPKLDKMGGTTFAKTRMKVQESLQKVAHQLLELYAARAVMKGHAYALDRRAIEEFEATFPFEETPDQLAAIEAVYKDMASNLPMDRLVCGDVGYGKTEVAIRAAFVAVNDNKQVAVLVPTTVLALQHFRSIEERFKDYPIRVELLSRFRTAKEQKETLERVRRGQVDIVVGTHRLLAVDVAFKDLGLLVVDEEHRFGVSHKERIKRMRKGMDVLTMTATPIPRTLHMALSGLRDFSLITTAPRDRQAIRTYEAEFKTSQIQEAIRFELARKGQVYFVHNRVQSIKAMAELLKKLVPEASIGVAHGQMEEGELERIMVEFIERKYDVLCCTTIIESGLDIPSANTIFINRADRFGLAQLYQLRGRVGRSSQKAFCYLLTPANTRLIEAAERRLQTLVNLTEMGSGFKVASEDLEMRGAGDLLGTSQSGNINAVGFDMYCELLERAVRELQGQELQDELEPDIDLKEPAYFPEDYIPELHSRLHYYKLLSDASEKYLLAERLAEIEDRFGTPPTPVKNLKRLMEVRLVLRQARVRALSVSGEKLTMRFDETTKIDRARLVQLITRDPKRYRLSSDQRWMVQLTPEEALDIGRSVKNLLQNVQ